MKNTTCKKKLSVYSHNYSFVLKNQNKTKFKRAEISRKIMDSKFPDICRSTHYLLITYKFSLNSMLQFEENCAYKLFITIFNTRPKLKVRAEIHIKIMKLIFPGYMHIYTLCPNCLHSFT